VLLVLLFVPVLQLNQLVTVPKNKQYRYRRLMLWVAFYHGRVQFCNYSFRPRASVPYHSVDNYLGKYVRYLPGTVSVGVGDAELYFVGSDTDPDPTKSFQSNRIRILDTAYRTPV
jgi:hypothetical protein